MKIKVINKKYEEVLALPKAKRHRPMKQHLFFRIILLIASSFDLMATRFKCRKIGMEKLAKNEPCLILMNHSSFIDLEIAASVIFPRRFNIVTTTDAFVGMNWIMRLIGCIPTKKFVTDANLIRDMLYAIKQLKSSVLMFPEAGYSFDGTATPLPDSLGRCVDKFFKALLELSAVLRSRDHSSHVYRDYALRLHLLGNFAAVDRLRKPFDDGRLSYARLADEDGVVLRPARENLDYALKLLLTPNHGVELPLPCKIGEVAPESVYRRRLLLLAVLALLRRRFAGVGRS